MVEVNDLKFLEEFEILISFKLLEKSFVKESIQIKMKRDLNNYMEIINPYFLNPELEKTEQYYRALPLLADLVSRIINSLNSITSDPKKEDKLLNPKPPIELLNAQICAVKYFSRLGYPIDVENCVFYEDEDDFAFD